MNLLVTHERFERQKILLYDKTGKSFDPFYQVSHGAGKGCPTLAGVIALPDNAVRRDHKAKPDAAGKKQRKPLPSLGQNGLGTSRIRDKRSLASTASAGNRPFLNNTVVAVQQRELTRQRPVLAGKGQVGWRQAVTAAA